MGVKKKLREAKFQLSFILSEIDKTIELVDGNKLAKERLEKIKKLLVGGK